jgi:serine/threonine-protein kinase
MTLVYVPEGKFKMGTNNGNRDEKPVHSVYLNAFWIDQTEVTNAMYAKCVQAGKCTQPGSAGSYTRESYYGNPEFDDYPVIYVSWKDANAYCAWAGRRLPTEAEWEKAARGTDARTYPWGDEELNSKLLNYNGDVGDTTEVGKYPDGASMYGAMDMAGNVWEWVGSFYQSYPYDANDGREDMSAGNGRIVIRGGAWGDSDVYLYSAYRDWLSPTDTGYYLGFRCARD